MMKKIYIISLLSVCLLLACSGESGLEKTELGFAFKHCISNKNTPKANAGDVVFGEMKILLNNKQLISSNYGSPNRLFVISKDIKVGSIDEFLTTLHIGDSVLMVAPADSVTKFLNGVVCKPTDKVYFYMTVSQIISVAELSTHDAELIEKQNKEEESLTEFVLEKYEKAEKKSSGLFYVNIQEGSGKKAEYGCQLAVNYTVTDTAGRIIDTSVEEVAKNGNIYRPNAHYAPFEFTLGDDGLIAGWSEGVSYMRAGGHAKFIIPSKLAYGELGYQTIEPFTPLIFDIYLLRVEK